MSVGEDRFRAALGVWATGVAIVTARAGDLVHGMTVSDFAGVSLRPPLVLVCADKTSNTLKVIEQGRNFAVNILAAGQAALSNRFASKKDEFRRFEGLECETAITGAPLIPGALVNMDCRLVAAHDAGDHVICVGEVEEILQRDAQPLLHWSRAYRSLATGE
jgi:flavin reductase (DIM6/NTAB) family NADH-FMN oxidoreductase RutF